MVSLNEFHMLMKIFYYKPSKEVFKQFEEYAVVGVDPANPQGRFLTIDQFVQLSLDKDYFTPKIQFTFCQSKVSLKHI